MPVQDPNVTYPRDVPLQEGMPEGWKGIEKPYGVGSKHAGQTYIRWFSLDGRHRAVCTPKQVFELHCKDNGGDPEAMLRNFETLREERKAAELAARQEIRGILQGPMRDAAIQKFRDKYGLLSGPKVFCFPGWKTRWDYQPNCQQVAVTYTDTDGREWKLLKDLEGKFGMMIGTPEEEELTTMMKKANELADPEKFAVGSRTARQSEGTYEVTATGEAKVLTQEEKEEIVESRAESAKRLKSGLKEKLAEWSGLRTRVGPGVHVASIRQSGWAALAAQDDVTTAFTEFRRLLVERGFATTVELIALRGLEENHPLAVHVHGVYVQLAEPFANHRCYKKLVHVPKDGEAPARIACDGTFIQWQPAKSQWHITTALDGGYCFAYTMDQNELLAQVSAPWMVCLGSTANYEEAPLLLTSSSPAE